ncbi:2-succinyl-6-hydroxy-2,4-cyclohexadiene-1-carboxylate synthase [Pseudogracilibacillus auburnensis]|uniref:2-succinyl-6-hydroxy-2, 4-cyclohexadiene-1-carboxylate synthase n=1 Tax=Pseudogracilibacillus auburnensis TaxID=1494959 RepID=UPI001A96C412|nr:2-succinyl-6-hydroxy-2,4-cyclohexadiene-1-carboxylate synthase [Pseudogracilibacillus auburnensis]MBO1005975.1 2-succinyl-6-hydroxy-2,4-cyclohexadiene-1-carboxylate synthase [Pseudogracilibacillus auburnensis]
MKFFVEGTEYHYTITGEGEPLLLLHGFTGDGSTWDQLESSLKNDFQIIKIDLIGHGKTSSPEDVSKYTMDSVTNHIALFMDHLHIEQAHILGYSMGGRLALGFAIAYPHKVVSLMLESASPGLRTAEERKKRMESDRQLAKRIVSMGIEAFIDDWENIPLFETQKALATSVQQRIREQRLQNHPLGLSNSLLGMGTGRQSSYWAHLNQLHIPVLLICGEWDVKFCQIAKDMEHALPNAEKVVVKNAGHAIHVEKPSKFGTIIKEFLFYIR